LQLWIKTDLFEGPTIVFLFVLVSICYRKHEKERWWFIV